MRRAALISAACLAGAVVLAGCGAQGVVKPVPKAVIGSLPTPTLEPATPAFKLKGDPTAAKTTFLKAGCTGCHTLADAHSTGTVGPNLDQAKPPLSRVVDRVVNGKNAMPPFKGTFSTKQIADVAAYVVKATGGNPNG